MCDYINILSGSIEIVESHTLFGKFSNLLRDQAPSTW